MVTKTEDFIDGQIFFVSMKRDEWILSGVKGYDQGYIQLFTFKYSHKLEIKDWLEYHDLFDYNSKTGYTLSKKGTARIQEGGYDYVHFIGEELDEAFIVNPAQQVIDILSSTMKAKNDVHIQPTWNQVR